MIAFKLPRRLLVPVATLLALTVAIWWAWQKFSRPWGDQAVNFAPARQQCHQEGPLRYCVYRASGGVNGDVLYHLHGRNLEAEIWNDPLYFTAMIQAHWQRAGLLPPTVVSLSYGPVWLLAPKGQAELSGLLDSIWPHITAIEALLGKPRRRLLMGESMGGLNSLVLGLSQPQHFDKVAALCPNVYQDSPFAPLGQIQAAMTRTGAEPPIIFGVWQLARRYVSDDQEWQRISPLALIEKAALQTARPSLYLSAGLYDRYGLYEGAEQLAQRSAQLGLTTEWHPVYGGHCAIDIASLSAFLVVR
ncbi:alpha/beta hydrolase-fold protein [Roseateles sp. DC23W]|uniref:Alpha/beta hydrolase-fold protein n=1 Tax=Pelomonas dachongensis TaxID=3299029 RepID=A0ABW7EFP4_9BURK